MIINPDNTHFISGSQPSDNFTLTQVETPLPSGGTMGTAVLQDITFTINTSAGVTNNFILSTTDPAVSYSVAPSTQAAATINASTGQAVMTGGGLCNFLATKQGFGSKSYSRTMASSSVTTYVGVTSYATTSLIKYLHDQMHSLLTAVNALGSNPGSNAINQQYTSYAAQTATLLTGLTVSGWTPFDATIVANNNVNQQAQAWISPHHWISGIGAFHGQNPVRGTTCFVGRDVVIGYSATPYAGTLASFLPVTWATYLPPHTTGYPLSGVPCFCKLSNTYNGSENWIEPVSATGLGFNTFSGLVNPPVDALEAPFCKTDPTYKVIGTSGDSGSPVFCGINGTPVLLGRLFGYGGSIDWYGDMLTAPTTKMSNNPTSNTFQNDITSAMNTLATLNSDATIYALQYVSLAGFNSTY